MKAPFHLKHSGANRPATALLVPGHDTRALLAICARLQLPAPPPIFVVADGYLVMLPAPRKEPLAGVVRLTEAGPNLLLPADGALLPTLLPDEAALLGSKRGLLFLPGGRVQEFDPGAPLAWSDLLQPTQWRRSTWQALPAPGLLAEQLREIVCERPEANADTILGPGGAGIGIEAPQPEDAPLAGKLLGRAALSLGQGLLWLGQALHLQGLASAGAGMIGKGLQLFPRLSEKLFGEWDAGLRALLREFQEGDVEKALRRALPLDPNMGRGSGLGQDAQLPVHDLRYSLGNILGGQGGGSIWLSNYELFEALQREYRKQAQQATRRGDFRRAAFIYGKLLHDFRLAAATLSQGGLHHDAAILYLEVVHDLPLAAQAFEADGDFDRALQLYRQLGMHVRAGDLLQRLGEEELAVAEYQLAAEEMVHNYQGHCQAGELLLQKARRADLAQRYFAAGWALRPHGSALACARQLGSLHAARDDAPGLFGLLAEAEGFFQPPGNEAAAGDFFNHLACLGERPGLAVIREELHDRVLLGLAHKLEQHATVGSGAPGLIPQLFPASTLVQGVPLWATNLVNDAQHALQRTRTPARRVASPGAEVLLDAVIPVARAVAQCPDTEEMFVGFESGDIACFDPAQGKVIYLPSLPGPVHQFTFGGNGDQLLALCQRSEKSWQLCCFERVYGARGDAAGQASTAALAGWELQAHRDLDDETGAAQLPRLLPSLAPNAKYMVGLNSADDRLQILSLPNLLPLSESNLGFALIAGFLLPVTDTLGANIALLAFGGKDLGLFSSINPAQLDYRITSFVLPHRDETPLTLAALRCQQLGPDHFELVGFNQTGNLFWIGLHLRGNQVEGHAALVSVPGTYQAAVLVREKLVVAVAEDRIVHLRFTKTSVAEIKSIPLQCAKTIACFACQRTGELFLVRSDGTLSRGPWLP